MTTTTAVTGAADATVTTAPHATSTNPFIASIQTAVISYFTAPSTIAALNANGLSGPVAPTDFVSALIYGFYRGAEQFAGLVPKTGTPTTTSDPVTGTVTGSLNVTEPAGAQLTYAVYTNPLFGSVNIDTSGTYTYKSNVFGSALAALGLNPSDTFTVTASDGVAATNETVTVPVLSANNTPSTPVASNVHENVATGVVTGILSATSPDNTAVSYHLLTGPLGGTLTLDSSTGEFTYTPTTLARLTANLGVITTDTFTVTAGNASGQTSAPGFITVPVSPASNDTPTSPTAINVNANTVTGTVTGTISASDPGGSALTYTATPPVSGTLTLNASTGVFTYTPTTLARLTANLGVITADVFTVTADNGTYTSTALITVPIEPAANDIPTVPVASGISLNSTTGVVTGTLTSTSPDGTAVTYSAIGLPTQGSITINGNTFTYVPTSLAQIESQIAQLTTGHPATDTFGVTASNGSFTSGLATVTVTISPVADTPTTPTVSNLSENTVTGVVTGTLTATDPGNLPLTYTVSSKPLGGSVTITGTTFTYTPTTANRINANLGVITTDTFTVTATNGYYTGGSTFVTVPVSPASNDTPAKPTSTVNENTITGVVTGTVTSTSPDGGAVTYSAGTPTLLTGSVTIDPSTGAYTYTPSVSARQNANLGVITKDTVTVTATNALGISSSSTLTVPISPATNDTPSKPTTSTPVQNKTTGVVTGTVTSTSPDGGAVTYSASIPTLLTGSVTINATTGAYTYTPTALAMSNATLLGPYSDTFTVTSSNGLSTNNATVTVPILAKSLL
ncbi:beta strand repeat-containing protein [Mycolicibacterium sp. J2]|uniref:beta strand repeat-containing protein n=1 Tax=Mycolicibacterium sp. J2 TaxID=2993511 RepID=UPI00224B6C9D|nr:Ig-like domain-containing protein [Mycolicibacterium sp. J2]MCX2711109.1 Ig-like domain-containing protein [Mycolicibacterium sp. J2]